MNVLQQSRQFLELIRFSHTIFALPFALASAVLAWQLAPFRWRDLLGILICMASARACAMAFNRIVDRRIDVERDDQWLHRNKVPHQACSFGLWASSLRT